MKRYHNTMLPWFSKQDRGKATTSASLTGYQRLTSVQQANVNLTDRRVVNSPLLILRQPRAMFWILWLDVLRRRFDKCSAVLVFQNAFYRPGCCHSHTLTFSLCAQLASTLFGPNVNLGFLCTQWPKTAQVFNNLLVITQFDSIKSGQKNKASLYVNRRHLHFCTNRVALVLLFLLLQPLLTSNKRMTALLCSGV